MDYYSIYVTTKNADEARAIGRALVEAQLAACVNIVPHIESIYAWQGKLRQDAEALLFAKTSSTSLSAAMDKVKELHGYDCPCIVALPLHAGEPAYLDWIRTQTG